MLQPLPALRVAHQPLADDERAGRVDDRVELLVGPEAALLAQRAIEALGDVADRDLAAQRDVVAEPDVLDGVPAVRRQRIAPWLEVVGVAAVAVQQHDRPRHPSSLSDRWLVYQRDTTSAPYL
ncbi:MAG: hypothetical protein QOJ89_4785 [bacterium]